MTRQSFTVSDLARCGVWKELRFHHPSTCVSCDKQLVVGDRGLWLRSVWSSSELRRGTTLCACCAKAEGLMR